MTDIVNEHWREIRILLADPLHGVLYGAARHVGKQVPVQYAARAYTERYQYEIDPMKCP